MPCEVVYGVIEKPFSLIWLLIVFLAVCNFITKLCNWPTNFPEARSILILHPILHCLCITNYVLRLADFVEFGLTNEDLLSPWQIYQSFAMHMTSVSTLFLTTFLNQWLVRKTCRSTTFTIGDYSAGIFSIANNNNNNEHTPLLAPVYQEKCKILYYAVHHFIIHFYLFVLFLFLPVFLTHVVFGMILFPLLQLMLICFAFVFMTRNTVYYVLVTENNILIAFLWCLFSYFFMIVSFDIAVRCTVQFENAINLKNNLDACDFVFLWSEIVQRSNSQCFLDLIEKLSASEAREATILL